MCTDDMTTARQPDPQVLHDFEPAVVFDLEPVDSVTVTTLADNVTDAFIPDQGPARRPPLPILRGGRQPTATMEGGDVPEVPSMVVTRQPRMGSTPRGTRTARLYLERRRGMPGSACNQRIPAYPALASCCRGHGRRPLLSGSG